MESTYGRIIELHRHDLAIVEITHRLGIAQSTVHYHLRKREGTGLGDRKPLIDPTARAPQPPSEPPDTRERVAQLLDKGLTRAEVARQLGLAKSVVSYHARRLGEPIDARCRARYDWAEVQRFYDEGNSVRECERYFGFCSASWTAAVRRGLLVPRPAGRPVEDIFVANSRRHRGHLKQRLLSLGLKENRCERCGMSEWRGLPLAAALHHINGDRLDNRLENLELLCPNCHSQTDTYAGRNRRGPANGDQAA